MTQVKVHGPGSRSEGNRVAETLTRGIESGAQASAATLPGMFPAEIGRLRLRLPAGAGEAEIARAFAEALAARGAGHKR
jgi:hypothetical protein